MTFLARDGLDKAPIGKPRLFPKGAHVIGGGVWFGKADPEHEFIIGEGVESTLSAMRIYGAAAGCAALSAAGITRLVLPEAARRVRIFSDHDPDGKGLAAACTARQRWEGEGRQVAISQARAVGEDANDIWRSRVAHG
jgi:putative DNA primase/helicase